MWPFSVSGFVTYLHMHQIPCALGCRAYLLAWWEKGTFCVEQLLPSPLPLYFSTVYHCGRGGLMAGLSSFATQQCSLHLGANRGSPRMSQAPKLHLATQLLMLHFTITAEILARSLANFYRQ